MDDTLLRNNPLNDIQNLVHLLFCRVDTIVRCFFLLQLDFLLDRFATSNI